MQTLMSWKSTENPMFRSKFSEDMFRQKYTHTGCETWFKLADTLVEDVCRDQMTKEEKSQLKTYIANLKFIPGGRYLYYAGRLAKFFNNCYLLRAEEDTREDWANLSWKSESALMTGGGIGTDYSVYRPSNQVLSKTGGLSSGPIPKMMMINEIGRHVMQGGSRRSAIYASLNWQHGDIHNFLVAKDWHNMPVGKTGKSLWDIKQEDFNFPAPLDMTNISVNYDTKWLLDYRETGQVGEVFRKNVEQALRTAEPGFSFNFFDKENETLRNAPVAADTYVMTKNGYRQVGSLVGDNITVWTGKQWASTTFQKTAESVPTIVVTMTGGRQITADLSHPFFVERWKGAGSRRRLLGIEKVAAQDLSVGDILHVSLPVTEPTEFDSTYYVYGYTYGDGSFNKRYNNRAEITFCTPDSKSCFSYMSDYPFISVNLSDKRGYTRVYLVDDWFQGKSKTEYPEHIWNPAQKVSFLAGLFDSDGSYDAKQKRIRLSSVHKTFLEGVRRELETLGIVSHINKGGISTYGGNQGWMLVIASEFISLFASLIPTKRIKPTPHTSYRQSKVKVVALTEGALQDVYCCDVGVTEHSFCAEGVIISNCTEVVSEDDSDVCNLGSINMGRIDNIAEFRDIVHLATKFLLCGTLVAQLPYDKVYQVREKNRRLGLGLMGIHEWLLKKHMPYEVTTELHKWLAVYQHESDFTANYFADRLSISRPVAKRAIAPTGSIGILAGTTTGIEPLFAVAYKRRYLKGTRWHFQYVVDGAAQEMIELYGVDPEKIESAVDLAADPERRIAFQADIQDYVDQSISSTINLPEWGSDLNNPDTVDTFAQTLAQYAHRLRGFTCYPNGARGGQPLTSIPYKDAVKKIGKEFVEHVETHDICDITGHGGSCGV